MGLSSLFKLMLIVLAVMPGESQESQSCLDDILAADDDGDMRLTSDEYLSLVSLQSDGRLEFASFSDMPLSFVAPYQFGACACARTSPDAECCVGDKANINIDPTSPEYSEDTLVTFCRSVSKSIDSALPATPAPSMAPVVEASDAPSSTPTEAPVVMPSESPTLAPVVPATDAPTGPPTPVPTPVPTMITPRPTAENELCITFQFGIINGQGFDADAIFNEVDNTLKTGLIIATENVTIESLNASFPDARMLRHGNRRNVESLKRNHVLLLSDEFTSRLPEGLLLDGPTNNARQLAYHAGSGIHSGILGSGRRLVFYTDLLPPMILSIIDNNFCPTEDPENTKCQIVSAQTCVFLEEGDERQDVRDELRRGIQTSIATGAFEAAIPEEHRLD